MRINKVKCTEVKREGGRWRTLTRQENKLSINRGTDVID